MLFGNSYCNPPPISLNAGAIFDIVTLSICFNTLYLWYAFWFSIYGSALFSYGTPSGDVYGDPYAIYSISNKGKEETVAAMTEMGYSNLECDEYIGNWC